MADNTTLNAGSGGDVIASDDILGVKYQRVKLSIGADGSATDAALTAPLPVQLSDGTSAITTLPVSLASVPSHAVTNAGTFAVQAAQSGTWNIGSVTTLPSIPAGSNLIGSVDINSGTANLSAAATGGYTPGRIVAAASTNTGVIKASAGTLGWLVAINLTATVKYLKLYNLAASPTLASDTPVLTIPIPANSTTGAGVAAGIPTQGLNFSTGIAHAITGAIGDTDTTALAANDVVVLYGYA